MRPVVHGLGAKYEGRLGILFLRADDPKHAAVTKRFGVVAAPHLVLTDARGRKVAEWKGVTSADTLERAIRGLLSRRR
jgi:thioredoxin-like negative regulator of GroEL